MKKINLTDGTKIHCLKETEALVLDEHISGYLEIGLDISEKDTIIDVGANIGVFGVRLSQKFQNISIYSFEPIPEIYKSLKKNSELKFIRGPIGVISLIIGFFKILCSNFKLSISILE